MSNRPKVVSPKRDIAQLSESSSRRADVTTQLLSSGCGYRSVEFWDVGGNPETALARRIFYKDSSAAGVLLVYDVSNPRQAFKGPLGIVKVLV